VGWVRPILVTISGVSRIVIVPAIDVGYRRDSLLVLRALVRVENSGRGVVDGRGRRVFVELVLVIEGGDLERLRNGALVLRRVDLGLKDIDFWCVASCGD
jgi:hypothetical protein